MAHIPVSMKRMGLFVLVLSVLSAAPSIAAAQKKGGKKGAAKTEAKDEAAAKDDAGKDAARELYKKGVASFKAQEFTKALDAFLNSYDTYAHFLTLKNIANCYEQLFDVPKAVEYYTRFLDEGGAEVKTEDRAELNAKLLKMSDKVGVLTVICEEEGDLIIDGKVAGAVPGTLRLYFFPGTHNVVLKSGGKIIFNEDVKLPGGSSEKVVIAAKKVEPPPPPPPAEVKPATKPAEGEGTVKKPAEAAPPKAAGGDEEVVEDEGLATKGKLHVYSSVEGSAITINGKAIGKAPWEDELKVGHYEVSVSAPDHPSWKKTIEVVGAKTTSIDVDLTATKKKAAPWWTITLSAGVVCAGLWAGFGAWGLQTKNDAKSIDPATHEDCAADQACIDRYNGLVDDAKTRFLVADVTGPLALVFAGATAALYVLVKKEKKEPKAEVKVTSLGPFLSPGGSGGGLALGGSF